MKSQIFYEPESMSLEDRPVPAAGDTDLLVQVRSVGICGSDVAYYFGNSSLETGDGKGPLFLDTNSLVKLSKLVVKQEQLVDLKSGTELSLIPFNRTQTLFGARKDCPTYVQRNAS